LQTKSLLLPSADTKKVQENVVYSDTGILLGTGKYGPVQLVVADYKHLRAVKRICKKSIDSKKRIEHVRQEKKILTLLAGKPFIVEMISTFSDDHDVCFVLEFIEGLNLY